MLHLALRAMGVKPYSMPAWPDLPPTLLTPTYEDIVTAGMLKDKRQFRQNAHVTHAPYVLAADYDRKSPAWQGLGTDIQDYLLEMMVPFHPLVALSIVPRSVRLVSLMAQEISLPDEVVLQPWKELDPDLFCTDGFNRHDCETLMVATAEAYGTQY